MARRYEDKGVTFTKRQLLKVIEILLKQLEEERKLRIDCLEEMLSLGDAVKSNSHSEEYLSERIKKFLESPGDKTIE
jgi:hypothetical protein